MLSVQMWELSLANLRLIIEIKPDRKSKSFERNLKRSIDRSWHVYRKASATDQAKQLKLRLGNADSLADVDALIKVRDQLAHRYLRERLAEIDASQKAGVPVHPAIFAELLGYSQRFDASAARLRAAFDAHLQNLKPQEPDPILEDMMIRLMANVIEGKPIERLEPRPTQ
jgi:hypothetical protein